MIDNSKEYILCAACWYDDGTEAPRGMIAQNLESGVLLCHWRHGNCINIRATNSLWNKKKLEERVNGEAGSIPMTDEKPDVHFNELDGFLTSRGRFVDRWQAAKIAMDSGQITPEKAIRTWDRSDEDISDEELLNSPPKYRIGPEQGIYRMIYSEDLY